MQFICNQNECSNSPVDARCKWLLSFLVSIDIDLRVLSIDLSTVHIRCDKCTKLGNIPGPILPLDERAKYVVTLSHPYQFTSSKNATFS